MVQPADRYAVAAIFLLAVAGGAPAAAATDGPWQLPAFDSCEPRGGLKGWPLGEDAPPFPFQPGDTFAAEQLPLLKDYFPPELWEQRERFFYEGMRLEIGPCFRDYSPPAFYAEATEAGRGSAQLLENGGLEGYGAGLPFAPDTIAEGDPQAGLKWAWNYANRYQGAGFRGIFRVSDMVGRAGRAEPFEGEIFKVQLSHRADRAPPTYQAANARGRSWVAGGKMLMPFNARQHAWRQYRNLEHEQSAVRSDDLHAYLPQWRRVRRLAAQDVEGLYMPSFSVGVIQPTSIAGLGDAAGGSIGDVATGGMITTKRSGFEGLEIRPLLYDWSVLGLQDVLAPINAARALYPVDEEREFGTWGLSFASDRWDLRRALVLQGVARGSLGDEEVSRARVYVDLQTLAPLYYMSWDRRDEALDVGMFVGRWSETRPDYPRWPDDKSRPIRVIDPVGAAFANIADVGGWRRESWEIVSTPLDDRAVKRLISVNDLTKGK